MIQEAVGFTLQTIHQNVIIIPDKLTLQMFQVFREAHYSITWNIDEFPSRIISLVYAALQWLSRVQVMMLVHSVQGVWVHLSLSLHRWYTAEWRQWQTFDFPTRGQHYSFWLALSMGGGGGRFCWSEWMWAGFALCCPLLKDSTPVFTFRITGSVRCFDCVLWQ